MQISVPDEYPWILLGLVMIETLCMVTGFTTCIKARKQHFNEQFLKEAGEKLKIKDAEKEYKLGFPDAGSGVFSHLLPYKQWSELNQSLRIHANLVEHLPLITTLLLVAGLAYPRLTLCLEVVYLVLRIVYRIAYATGANLRLIGAVPIMLMTNGLALTSMYFCYTSAA